MPSKTSVCTLKPEADAKPGMPMCLELWQVRPSARQPRPVGHARRAVNHVPFRIRFVVKPTGQLAPRENCAHRFHHSLHPRQPPLQTATGLLLSPAGWAVGRGHPCQCSEGGQLGQLSWPPPREESPFFSLSWTCPPSPEALTFLDAQSPKGQRSTLAPCKRAHALGHSCLAQQSKWLVCSLRKTPGWRLGRGRDCGKQVTGQCPSQECCSGHVLGCFHSPAPSEGHPVPVRDQELAAPAVCLNGCLNSPEGQTDGLRQLGDDCTTNGIHGDRHPQRPCLSRWPLFGPGGSPGLSGSGFPPVVS